MSSRPAIESAESAGPDPVRVFVVDYHELFRSGLCGLLAHAGMEVVGEAGDARSACEAVPLLSPDVVLVDESLPRISGVEAIRRLAETAPRARAVLFAIAADGASVMRAIAAGAHGYLLKDTPTKELIDAVRAAAAGSSPISPRAAAALFERLRAEDGEGARREHAEPGLTDRETEVLLLLVAGRSNVEIAAELLVSPPTVKRHVSSVLAKLGVENRVQAAVRAVRDRIV